MDDEQVQTDVASLNPRGVLMNYTVDTDAQGNITGRQVSVVLNVLDTAGIRNGVLQYADRIAKGEEI